MPIWRPQLKGYSLRLGSRGQSPRVEGEGLLTGAEMMSSYLVWTWGLAHKDLSPLQGLSLLILLYFLECPLPPTNPSNTFSDGWESWFYVPCPETALIQISRTLSGQIRGYFLVSIWVAEFGRLIVHPLTPPPWLPGPGTLLVFPLFRLLCCLLLLPGGRLPHILWGPLLKWSFIRE